MPSPESTGTARRAPSAGWRPSAPVRRVLGRWALLVARLLVGGVWIAAGVLKLGDPDASVRAVRAYRLLPEAIVPTIGYGLPLLEIGVGALLVIGLGTRVVAALSVVLFAAFVIGIASAWARGLQIDCGCFGGGGFAEDATDGYPLEIARDVGLLVLSGALIRWPRSALAADNRFLLTEETDESVIA